MATQEALDEVYMQSAILQSTLSKANRRKVGAILVTREGVILSGYNGTPSGCCNVCEEETYGSTWHDSPVVVSQTKKEVIHAELNCILKAAREGVSVKGSTLYITLSPCLSCAGMIAQAGITRVVYKDEYRDLSGVNFLQKYKNKDRLPVVISKF